MREKTRDEIWKLVNYIEWGDMLSGYPIDGVSKELVNMPSFDEMFEKAIHKLLAFEFSVKHSDIHHANIVLRIIRQKDCKIFHNSNKTFWIYGIDVFIKTVWGFYSEGGVLMNANKQIITFDLRPEFDTEDFEVTIFKDYFLKIR